MENIMCSKDPPGLYKPGLQAKLAMEKVVIEESLRHVFDE